MINIEKTNVVGFEDAIRGMRNPKNSWNRSDSGICKGEDNGIGCDNCVDICICDHEYDNLWKLGKNDHHLMESLAAGGPVHAKYRRMIIVYVDVTAPLYWWKEFDTYKVGTVANSCSTMHKIQEKEFDISDFSTEHLTPQSLELLEDTIILLNNYRVLYNCKTDQRVDSFRVMTDECYTKYKKDIWWQMIQLLPSSYNQKRTLMLNYEVLANIYYWRHNHKLDEWHTFCDWIRTLPHADLIIRKEGDTI